MNSKVTLTSLAVILFVAFTLSTTGSLVGGLPATDSTGSDLRSTAGHRKLLNLSGNAIEDFEMPPELAVGSGSRLLHVFKGQGIQEYLFDGATWKLVNASAVLSTFAGEDIGRHFFLPEDSEGGLPSWESFSPYSLVTAVPERRVSVSSDSIPWVLLKTTSSSGSPSYFGSVTYVQRLFTNEGLPPNFSIYAETGDRVEERYSAQYYFYN